MRRLRNRPGFFFCFEAFRNDSGGAKPTALPVGLRGAPPACASRGRRPPRLGPCPPGGGSWAGGPVRPRGGGAGAAEKNPKFLVSRRLRNRLGNGAGQRISRAQMPSPCSAPHVGFKLIASWLHPKKKKKSHNAKLRWFAPRINFSWTDEES